MNVSNKEPFDKTYQRAIKCQTWTTYSKIVKQGYLSNFTLQGTNLQREVTIRLVR